MMVTFLSTFENQIINNLRKIINFRNICSSEGISITRCKFSLLIQKLRLAVLPLSTIKSNKIFVDDKLNTVGSKLTNVTDINTLKLMKILCVCKISCEMYSVQKP